MSFASLAADVGAPRAYEADKPYSGVISRATSGASARYQIPDGWRGSFVALAAKGQDLQFAFGGPTIALTFDADSALAGEVLTPVAGSGWPVSAGSEAHFRIPEDRRVTHFAVVAAGAGRVSLRLAQGIGG